MKKLDLEAVQRYLAELERRDPKPDPLALKQEEEFSKVVVVDGVEYVKYAYHLREVEKLKQEVSRAFSDGKSCGPEYSWRL